ncbi:TrkH family potassium uptake protein [Oricola cellulosilytica]|uniref:Trk system potassium uptake protein n=2 Tax=Oricola cellulosilytica TaxID=1429082 RepID=A0A4R0PFY7_9HYPH|nr:TrkH family potassium uptake protein [Oricola cellulosilytica]
MLIPALVDAIAGNPDWQVFAASSAATTLVGVTFYAATRGLSRSLSTRQAMLMTVVVWVALVTAGALPFRWSGIVPTYTDAFFEAMSGLTTTGATVIVGLDEAPPGILLWRGMLQWLGGLGIIVMAVAVLPMLQIGGMQVFKAEAFDTPEKILPRATQISGSMTLIFVAFTAACAISYIVAGMQPGEALIHAMTTVATGGFSTRDSSIGFYQAPAIEWIAIVFMLAGSIPFLIYVQVLQGRPIALWRDQQVRTFLAAVLLLTLIGWLIAVASRFYPSQGEAFRTAAFNVVSIMTGTGYASADYGSWSTQAIAFFFIIMFIGGCAGSTSCGIKIFRFQVLFGEVRERLARVLYPHGVFVKRFNGRALDDRVPLAVTTFVFLYLAAFAVISVALRATGLDLLTAVSGAGSAISNVGPGLGPIIGPTGTYQPLNDTAKWLLSFAMLLGRLELFTVLVLFLPRFWRT